MNLIALPQTCGHVIVVRTRSVTRSLHEAPLAVQVQKNRRCHIDEQVQPGRVRAFQYQQVPLRN